MQAVTSQNTISLGSYSRLASLPRFLGVRHPDADHAWLRSLSPRVMQWSDDIWIMDLMPCLSYWKRQAARRNINPVSLIETVLRAGSPQAWTGVLAFHPWQAVFMLPDLTNRHQQSGELSARPWLINLAGPFGSSFFRDSSMDSWFAATEALSRHYEASKRSAGAESVLDDAVVVASLAEAVGVRAVQIPPWPGLFSSLGLLLADYRHDHVRSLAMPVTELSTTRLAPTKAELQAAATSQLAAEGVDPAQARFHFSADLRYAHQVGELSIDLPEIETVAHPGGQAVDPLVAALRDAFTAAHRREFGYERDDEVGPLDRKAWMR